jgi:hypothetical protein
MGPQGIGTWEKTRQDQEPSCVDLVLGRPAHTQGTEGHAGGVPGGQPLLIQRRTSRYAPAISRQASKQYRHRTAGLRAHPESSPDYAPSVGTAPMI